ncbi:ATP-binding protein [uncultured Acinetobacter sp.]|uniref:sensor histidine kinase n=1 Tax=uncultured Acinetobacter sp. TaxID=165433 RepID=UPI00260866D9|nr:ATP-binding protein [uncultured Acinetobacter sp.]
MTQARSLQGQLIKSSMLSSMLAGMLALLIFVGLSLYHTMHIYDEIMDEVADMLLITDISSQMGNQVDELSQEFLIQYSLNNADFNLFTSDQFDFADVIPVNDYAVLWHQGQLWRSYVLEENNMQAHIYQPISVRLQDLGSSLTGFLAVLLLLWLLQWGLVRFAIQRQFKSLTLLSQNIQQKNAQDLTPIVSLQPEFLELQPIVKQLNQLLARLDQSLHAEQRFTADASHELRSPLSAIQMRLQVLKRKYQDQVQWVQDLQPIQNDVARSTQILENLLLLARLDPSQADALAKTECDLHAITLEVLDALFPFIEDKKIVLDVALEEYTVQGNRELLFTCIRNLIDNAVRYSPHASTLSINIKASTNSLCISNQGEPISDEVLARLGERFYRALGTKSSGSGLGISICQKIIALHHAQLNFSANPSGGLTAQIQFK